jgi:nicotinate-nucleotide adenylyltransferase
MGTNTGERIGILGGTFDPPHLGHLIVADQVLRALDLDRVLLVPANEPWQKVGIRPITSAEKRLIMTRDAVGDAEGLAVSDIELRLGGPSYTSVTLDALAENQPKTEWRIIVGADAAAGLDTWHNLEKLRTQADIVVVNRPGADFQPPTGWSWELVEIPAVNISGTGLRRRVSQGRSIRFLTPNAVIDHIDSWGLYRGGP